MKEMMDCKEIDSIDWVDTSGILADTLTKREGNSSWIRSVIAENVL